MGQQPHPPRVGDTMEDIRARNEQAKREAFERENATDITTRPRRTTIPPDPAVKDVLDAVDMDVAKRTRPGASVKPKDVNLPDPLKGKPVGVMGHTDEKTGALVGHTVMGGDADDPRWGKFHEERQRVVQKILDRMKEKD